MRRLTTPTHTFELKDFDTSLIQRIKITYAQGGNVILEKRDGDLTVGDNKAVVKLTQEDTKKFSANRPVEIQVRILTSEGEALASNITTVSTFDVLDNEVLV